ncbi:GNAT family N-acetyltransferase [Jidongwangia harbinensis]|uniref:GNAT family N-acetyltransferase n=1 Tax=Jidongwangia harbinensis TaxID=2878561 RepID=UPI001CD95BD3|nr:GNAT family N-acetyltransferase [Jidongwangia harbinensis]MCA2211615.1 GNAT family N-acetyltransferase [Jidongwangia harbinensis]
MLEVHTGAAMPPPLVDDLVDVYTEVFGAAPWHEHPAAAHRFRRRLAADAGRDGFRLVTARTGDRIDGFATGWLTRTPLPAERAYPAVTRQLGPDRVRALLDTAFEVDELAVRPAARGRNLGRRLLHLITGTAPHGRAWLLTSRHAADTVAFYRRTGWTPVTPLPGTGNDVVVFLAPQHPHGLADTDLSGVVAAWVHGWAISRTVPAPTAVPGGWRIPVGLPGHRLRYVLPACDEESLAGLSRRPHAPGTWIKVAGEPACLRRRLPSPWAIADTGHLMTAPFSPGAATAPAPYTIRITTTGAVIVASVVDAAGDTAASGRLAPAGRTGVIDRVETAPRHRRRGLGTAVVRALSDNAARRGMHTGVLVATDDGRDLYRALGWTVRSPMAAAHLPEPPG